MRWISNIFIYIVAVVFVDAGELEANSDLVGGYLRVVNAVGGDARLHVELDGKPLNERGIEGGSVTGGLWVPDGKYRLECSLEGAESLNQEYEMHAGKTVVLLVHIVELPTRDGNPGGWALQVSELMAQQPVKGKTLTVLSLSSRKDLKVELGNTDRSWAGVAVKPGKVKRQSLEWPHGYVPVMLDGKRLGSIPVAASANYVVVFYDGFDRRVRLMQFKDRVFGAIP